MAPVVQLSDSTIKLMQETGARILPAPAVSKEEFDKMDLRGRLRLGCDLWAKEGVGSPVLIFLYYIIKSCLYLLGFRACLGRSSLRQLLASSKLRQDTFCRFIVYNLLFEVLGLGCSSGPLSGRVVPPHTAWFHWLCPGTLKLPFRANGRDSRRPLLPWLHTKRTKMDVALFGSYLVSLVRALFARRVTPSACKWICGLLGSLALVDHTAFLASRGEVYGYMLAVHAAGGPLAGMQCVQWAIYFWAAVSKLGPWFRPVIQGMLSNSPSFPAQLRPLLYRDLKAGDFRTSYLSTGLATLGTTMELAIPAFLPWGGLFTPLGMFLSISMHCFIFLNFALAVPQEWNIFTPLSVAHLFLANGGMDWRGLQAMPSKQPLLSAFLAAALGLVPLAGSFYPPSNSFLTSMKYYAGNWPNTQWVVKRSALHKFDKLLTLAPLQQNQFEMVYGRHLTDLVMIRVLGFRGIHLPSRCLPKLLELALQGRDVRDFQFMDGENVAGTALGYNFGDGYLSGRFLCQAIQDICGFSPGELTLIMIDSCPAHLNSVPWSVRDATALWDDEKALGVGEENVGMLTESQPY